MDVLTGLSTYPETQIFLVLTQYFRKLELDAIAAIWTSIRGNKPWTSSSFLFLWCRGLQYHSESCIPYIGSPRGRQAGQTSQQSSLLCTNSNHQRETQYKRVCHVSQQPKGLASCCCVLIGPKLVTLEISSIRSSHNLCWWNLSNPIAFYDSKWSFSTASLLS